jgi:hypothetical protein
MGIDAEMLVRKVPRHIVTDEWLKALSWRLCQAIDPKKFFISDGLKPDEYEKANKAWHAAFDGHPLYARFHALGERSSGWPRPEGSEADREEAERLRLQILKEIGEAPKARRLAIEPTMSRYREDGDPEPGAEYHEDSDEPIKAEGGECLLQLALWGRYYGPGYERGDILSYCAIAEWLEINIPGCEVWYGGDSSGVCAEPFHDLKRRELRKHLFSDHGRDYFNRSWMETTGVRPPSCSLCPGGKYCGSAFGSGMAGKYSAFHCGGCGKSVETRDGGDTWTEKKDD